MSSKENFTVFVRTWWRNNKEWPNGLEPHMGRKKIIKSGLTYDEAVQVCKEWNNSHEPGKLSRKAELSNDL